MLFYQKTSIYTYITWQPAKALCFLAFLLCVCVSPSTKAFGAAENTNASKEILVPKSTPTLQILGKKLILVENAELTQKSEVLRKAWMNLRAEHDPKVFEPKNIPLPAGHQKQYAALAKIMPKSDPLTRLRNINGFFNNIPSREDLALYGKNEHWAAPHEFLKNRAGDCEDYAFAKFFALNHFGWPKEDLWVVLLYDKINDGMHAILAAKHKKNVFILDNLSQPSYLLIPEKQYTRQVRPFAVLNHQGLWLPLKTRDDSLDDMDRAMPDSHLPIQKHKGAPAFIQKK